MKTKFLIIFYIPLVLGVSGCTTLKELKTDLASMASSNENANNKREKLTKEPTLKSSPAISSGCSSNSNILNKVPTMSQGQSCQMAPKEYQTAYNDALKALESESWKALVKSTKIANKVSIDKYGSNHYATTVILTLQAFNKIENTSLDESVLILEKIIKKRRDMVNRLEESIRATMPAGEFFTLHNAIREQLPATDLYLSGHKKQAGQFYDNPLMEYMISRYTMMGNVDPNIHEVDLFIATVQLTTYATTKMNDGKIDDAYDALLSVSMIDKVLLENLGFVERPMKSSLTIEESIIKPSEKSAIELRGIMLLSGKEESKETYIRSKRWIGMYGNSSNKMKGFAYFMLANASEDLKYNDTIQNYSNALKYLNMGYGNGNFMSASIDYILLSDKIDLDQHGDFNRGEMYKANEAKPRIKLINDWINQYSSKVPENRFFENILLLQSAHLHFGADIPTDDPRLQPYLNGFDKMQAQMSSGDLNAMFVMIQEFSKTTGGNEDDAQRIEQIPIQYFNIAISDNQ